MQKNNNNKNNLSTSLHRNVDNIYIGYGHKFSCSSYTPAPLPTLEIEYTMAPDMLEVIDPSVEDEKIYELKINNDDEKTDDDANDVDDAEAEMD